MKRTVLLLAASFVLLCSNPLAALAQNETDSGDQPQPEVSAILQEAVGASSKSGQQAAVSDIDYNGWITAADAALLLHYEDGMLTALPLSEGQYPAPSLESTLEACKRVVIQTMEKTDFSVYTASVLKTDLSTYTATAACRDAFCELRMAISDASERALAQCMQYASRDLRLMNIPIYPSIGSENLPDWKSLASIYRVLGEQTMEAVLQSVQLKWKEMDDGKMQLLLCFGTHDEIADFGDRQQFMNAKFGYAYLNTVFDDEGQDIVTEKNLYPEWYLKTIVHPLPGCVIKNGWFDPRDKHTRYHTGTDILANGKTKILSATDGTVLYIGYMSIPGNYVVVRDPYGYEYHYYHMYEKTKFVKEGDTVQQGTVLGLVGNTGNSAANHLHLTIISPEYTYLNPYDLYVQAGIGPIKPEE